MAKRKLKGETQAELTQAQGIIKTKDCLLNEQRKEIQRLKQSIEKRDKKNTSLESATIGLLGDYHLAASELLRTTVFKGKKFSLPTDNPASVAISAFLNCVGVGKETKWERVDEPTGG